MRADRITVGTIVDLGIEKSKDGPHLDRVREPAKVMDTESEDQRGDGRVALKLRQEGKRRGCWVAMPATDQVKTLRR